MAQTPREDTNAVDMLKKDHETVTDLFGQFERAEVGERQAIATQIFNELTLHTILEEEIFYPAVREHINFEDVIEDEEVSEEASSTEEEEELDEDMDVEESDDSDDIIAVSYEEHQIVKDLIQELKGMDAQSADYKTRFGELKDAVLDHVSEEEELIFPAARLKLDVNALGEQMQQRRIAVASSMAA
ncbi:hemerythrin domain-containing protein [Nitrospira sp. Nam74]